MRNRRLMLYGLLLITLFQHACFLTQIPTVESYREMPSRKIEAGASKSFTQGSGKAGISNLEIRAKGKHMLLKDFLTKSNTSAFLIFKKNKLEYEWYDNENFNAQEIHPSFSLAKSITSALLGIAIEEGKINTVEDEVLKYLPELDSNEFKGLKIIHLLQMTSGIRHSELEVFHTTNAASIFKNKKLSFAPGKKQEYWSTVTQLLGLVLQKAIAPQTISDYLSEKIWKPMGAESSAYWTVDHLEGVEKTFCCIQATARDFMRFGLVYLNNGYYNGQQIVPQQWIQQSIAMNEEQGSIKKYNYGWWFPFETVEEYTAQGFKGQYIFINQNKETVIVRLGKNRDGISALKWSKILSELNSKL